MVPIRFVFAVLIVGMALLLPPTLRRHFFSSVAAVTHFPFRLFGRIARYILKETETENPFQKNGPS